MPVFVIGQFIKDVTKNVFLQIMNRKENYTPRQRAPQVSRKLLGRKKVDILQKGKADFTGKKKK